MIRFQNIMIKLLWCEYEIVTEKGDRFQVSIKNKFMINNSMLN
jgi:hypothetical protein